MGSHNVEEEYLILCFAKEKKNNFIDVKLTIKAREIKFFLKNQGPKKTGGVTWQRLQDETVALYRCMRPLSAVHWKRHSRSFYFVQVLNRKSKSSHAFDFASQ